MNFDWEDSKNLKNIKKHGIDFNDLIPVFFDDNAISYEDKRFDYPDGQRMIIIGQGNSKLLYVAYAEIEDGEIIKSYLPVKQKNLKSDFISKGDYYRIGRKEYTA